MDLRKKKLSMIKYDDILSIDKIIDVYKNIYSNTKHKEKLVRFEMSFSCNVINILNQLKTRIYHHGHYSVFLISIPKYRIIMSETMKDKIVNHLVSKYILIPTLSPKLIDMNVATRKGKGTKMGIYYTKKYINKMKMNYDDFYVLKCDISKYFYNIDHKILLQKLSRDIKDEEILQILTDIISSTDNDVNERIDNIIVKEIERLQNLNISDFEKKKLELSRLPRYKRGTGLPIGNETSQILAVYYLNGFDHFVKEKLRIKCYIRYMDDFILFHHDKEYLKYCLKEIEKYLKTLKLTLNRKTQIYNIKKGFNFLGYKFFLKEKKLIIILNNQTKKRIKRKLRNLKKKDSSKYLLSKASYKGYFLVAKCSHFIYKAKL